MVKIPFIVFILMFCQLIFSQEKNCVKQKSLQQYTVSIESLDTQISQIENVLLGQKVEGFVAQSFFGHDFKIDQTAAKIALLEDQIKQKNGLALELETLAGCLKTLKLEKNLNLLSEKSLKLTQLKIDLLKKNNDLGDSLRKGDLAESGLPELKQKLDQDSTQTEKQKSELESNLIKTTIETSKVKSAKTRELLSYSNELTKLKIELLELKIKANKTLEEKIDLFEKYSINLKSLSADIKDKDKKKIQDNFLAVENVWLSLAKENYYDIFWSRRSLLLPEIPTLIEGVESEAEYANVIKSRDELIDLRKEILTGYTSKKTQEIKLLNQLVTNSNSIRTSYYNQLGLGYFLKSLLKLDSYKLFKNEIVTAPYRITSYFYKKYLYVQEQFSLGKEGYVILFSHSLVFAFLALIFFTMRTIYQRLSDKIDNLFRFLFKRFRGRAYFLRKFYALWVKLKDSSSSILWLLTLSILDQIKYFDDFSLLIKAFEVYLLAAVIKSFVTLFLGAVSRLDSVNFQQFKIKAEETSNKFKNIFLFYFLTLIFIEATVGRVYLYTLLFLVVFIYSLVLFLKESSRWEEEFVQYAEKHIAGVIVERFLNVIKFFPKRFRAAFLLFFIITFMIFNLFVSLTENFEISKKISANLFKKQIEKVEAELGAWESITQDYKDYFSPKSLEDEADYVENAYGLEEKIENEILEWKNDISDEHSLVIYGDKGIGKTTLLKKISSILSKNEELDVKYVKIPAKMTDKQAVHQFIGELFDTESNEHFDLYRLDKKLTKRTVIVIDETQNIFLSQTGGFDAYYALINIINYNTENIFWVMSFNKYSWLYLDRAFGRNQFFRNVYEVKGWSDVKIKELIMKRHNKTNYQLSYDLLINATRSQDEIDKYASIESKFFKLLWELSRGNPRAALFLWLSALSRKGSNTLNVNVPKEIDLDGIEKMPDDILFVIAHVLKHENLSASEIESTTNLQRGLVRNAIKLALEKRFFYKDERSRYMVDISTQYGLIRYLRLKNFIYGS